MVFLGPVSAREGILGALNLSTSDSISSCVTVHVHYSGKIFAVYSDPSCPHEVIGMQSKYTWYSVFQALTLCVD